MGKKGLHAALTEQAWIVMELVEGDTLKALIDRGERLDTVMIMRIVGRSWTRSATSIRATSRLLAQHLARGRDRPAG